MPQISVIVPVYKVEPYLQRCVDSILGQTYTDFELILVDDGSPDNCPVICDEYAKNDSRVHVIHQENAGLSAARNSGIDWAFANSDSKWLSFVDSDDWIHVDYLKTLITAAEMYNARISICDYIRRDSYCEDTPINESQPLLLDSQQAYTDYYGICLIACSKIYHKSLFSELRFPVGKLHEDVFLTHLLMFSEKIVVVNLEKLYYYFNNQKSIMRSPWTEKRLDAIEAREKRLRFLKENDLTNAYKREIIAYLNSLLTQYKSIIDGINITPTNYNTAVQLLKKFRKKLLYYFKIGMLDFHENYHLFEVAFPKTMRAYWLMQAVLKKIRLRK